ncbi:uncharacterized protein MELLADRAFT_30153, partial [Melampsora larici-populina 98AG31]
IINVWRPVHAVQDNPLGLCKWNSLLPEDTLQAKITPTTAENSMQAWRYREGQDWFYLSKQQPSEVYAFMQHDSRGENGHGVNVPHASFTLTEDREKTFTRISFECRVIAIVD